MVTWGVDRSWKRWLGKRRREFHKTLRNGEMSRMVEVLFFYVNLWVKFRYYRGMSVSKLIYLLVTKFSKPVDTTSKDELFFFRHFFSDPVSLKWACCSIFPPLGPCPIIRAEESSREAFVQDLGGRIARFVPGTSAMFFFLMEVESGVPPRVIFHDCEGQKGEKDAIFPCFFCDGRNCKIAFAMSGGQCWQGCFMWRQQLEEHICWGILPMNFPIEC